MCFKKWIVEETKLLNENRQTKLPVKISILKDYSVKIDKLYYMMKIEKLNYLLKIDEVCITW